MDQFIEDIDACTGSRGTSLPRGAHGLRHHYARHGLRTELQRLGPVQTDRDSLALCRHAPAKRAISQKRSLWRHTEGLIHGFLVVRTLEGKAVAMVQMTQDARAIVNHPSDISFQNGFTYEDTTIFSHAAHSDF